MLIKYSKIMRIEAFKHLYSLLSPMTIIYVVRIKSRKEFGDQWVRFYVVEGDSLQAITHHIAVILNLQTIFSPITAKITTGEGDEATEKVIEKVSQYLFDYPEALTHYRL